MSNEKGTKVGSFIAPCAARCKSEFQDERYKKLRLHNRNQKGGCCTVCGEQRLDPGN